jgi:hopene-associated glycosyltransferase HpnB
MAAVLAWIAGSLAVAIWAFLALCHGRFWSTAVRLPAAAEPRAWPSVAAIVPARDEAEVLPGTLAALLGQRYPGPFRVVVVDDASSDATAELAASAGAEVVPGSGPPAGWSGKVAAMAAGVSAAGEPDYLLFTDADVEHPSDAVRRLVCAARAERLALTSLMVRLRTDTGWERLLVPAFVYFFAQLYPFRRVNRPGRTAAAAGGCMLVDRTALAAAGGLAAIRAAVIDDVALARTLKPHGRIWLGLATGSRSVRAYPRLAELWRMVARSAYTQLRYSPLLLLATVLGLLVVYLLPPILVLAGAATGAPVAALLGAAAWAIMTSTYVPMLRFYRLAPVRAVLLPAVALLYAAMTLDSARRHRAGRGAEWKGRVATR